MNFPYGSLNITKWALARFDNEVRVHALVVRYVIARQVACRTNVITFIPFRGSFYSYTPSRNEQYSRGTRTRDLHSSTDKVITIALSLFFNKDYEFLIVFDLNKNIKKKTHALLG